MNYPTGDGDCFVIAANIVVDWRNEDTGLLLVHGIVVGQGKIVGIEHAHAWVEDGDYVIDRSNGKNVTLPKDLYYAIGKIKYIVRYTREEARRMMLEHETFGPWETNLL